MGYVFPTLGRDGLRLCDQRVRLSDQPLIGPRWAWAGFGLVLVGAVMAITPVTLGRASVLYTFYPPLIGNAFYYIGVVLVVVGIVDLGRVDVDQSARLEDEPIRAVRCRCRCSPMSRAPIFGPGRRLARRSNFCCSSFPSRSALTSTINVGLARVFFSWTLHAIVYFWLIPTYIAYYTILPRAIGGKIYSDTMMRLAFISVSGRRDADRHPSHVRRPGGRRGLQVHPLDLHRAGRGSDPAHGLHHLRFGGDRRAPARRAGPVRLARGVAVEKPDHAGLGLLLRDARLRRRGRPDQHELPARRDRPQHAVGHRTLSPHLRRRDRDHVFCDRLRPLASSDRPRAGGPRRSCAPSSGSGSSASS